MYCICHIFIYMSLLLHRYYKASVIQIYSTLHNTCYNSASLTTPLVECKLSSLSAPYDGGFLEDSWSASGSEGLNIGKGGSSSLKMAPRIFLRRGFSGAVIRSGFIHQFSPIKIRRATDHCTCTLCAQKEQKNRSPSQVIVLSVKK